MKFNPYQYQTAAVQWVLDRPRCCLFLDMGLGKSVITLTAIRQLIDEAEISSALVVAPKTVAETTWSDEAEKWDHLADLRVSRVIGTPARRKVALEAEADVYVIGRDSFAWLVGYYNGRLPFNMIVLDELSSFKSPTSKRFKSMRKVTAFADRVVGLTGTPAPNGLVDLWAQLYCIDMGDRLGKSVTRYRDEYFHQITWQGIVVRCTPKKGTEERIRRKLSDICLSMSAADYLQLPDMMVRDVMVTLSPSAMKRYTDFERDSVDEVAGGDATIIAQSAAGLMAKLSQYASGAVYDDKGEVQDIHTEKLDRLVELVEAAQSPVLVFYQYRHEIPRITEALKGYKVEQYQGADQLRAWNAGDIDVLLAHPASTAFGLNMQQGGHHIVWFGTGWNLELYQQANARLHRQGQRHTVMVHRLLCRGTVDERAAAALDAKKNVQQALLDGMRYLLDKHGKGQILQQTDAHHEVVAVAP